MPLGAFNPSDHSEPHGDPCDVLRQCPICGGLMETVYKRNRQTVCVCVDCRSGLTVPDTAWDVARVKREAKWMPGT
jgi:hypothetical protein